MAEENFEDWDTDFLEEAIKVEEQHLSSQCVPLPPPLPTQATTSSYLPHEPPLLQAPNLATASRSDFVSYSPPRELSQRTADHGHAFFGLSSNGNLSKCAPPSTPVRRSDRAKDLEIERLKRELGHVSRQLTELEQQCLELRKGREKEANNNFMHPKNEEHDDNTYSLKRANQEHGLPDVDKDEVPVQFRNATGSDGRVCTWMHIAKSSCKEIGVQTELPAHLDLSRKLLDIWGSTRDQKLGKNLIAKLLVACPTDFHVLFGYISMNTSSEVVTSLGVGNSTYAAFQYHTDSSQASEAEKVSHFYSVVTRISSGLMRLEALFEPLFALCGVKNVVIVHRSLRILHVLLKHFLACDRQSKARNNVMVEECHSSTNVDLFHGSGSTKGVIRLSDEENGTHISFPLGSSAENSQKKECQFTSEATLLSCITWISLFEWMHQIATTNTEEHVRLEAVSIMNVILMRSNVYTEREKFGLITTFENISPLLRKEAGLRVRKETVHLLYLMLNCPKLSAMFCSSCKERESPGAANNNGENTSTLKGFDMILEGLADCLTSCHNGVEELELCRNVIIVLAFIASSGKFGSEILANQKLSRDVNFVMLILQLLVAQIEIEAVACGESAEIFKKRTLLMREALILLNRLVSNPLYSATVLRALTNSRDMASMTVDVANRLSRNKWTLQEYDPITRQMRESEIVDLARIFKKRVFTFLGDNIS